MSKFSKKPKCYLLAISLITIKDHSWNLKLNRTAFDYSQASPHVKESGKILLVESEIRKDFAYRIRNTAQGIWNPTNDWTLLTKTRIHTWNPQSRIQDCLGLPYYMGQQAGPDRFKVEIVNMFYDLKRYLYIYLFVSAAS